METRALGDLHSLELQDRALALEAGAAEALLAAVDYVRRRAEAIEAFFAAYAGRELELRDALTHAEDELAAQRAAHAEAERDVSDAGDGDDRELELRQRALERAADHVGVAERELERARAGLRALEREANALPKELLRLEAEARRIAAGSSSVPTPGGAPRELVAWASHARAELFVTLSQLATRRDRVIREANELASSLLGEPTYGSTVAQALRRVEAR